MVVGVGVLALTGGGGGNFADGESTGKAGLVERAGLFWLGAGNDEIGLGEGEGGGGGSLAVFESKNLFWDDWEECEGFLETTSVLLALCKAGKGGSTESLGFVETTSLLALREAGEE